MAGHPRTGLHVWTFFELADFVASDVITSLLINPAIEWFKTHSAALGLNPAELASLWAVLGFLFFLSSVIGTIGGRIGWALFGALTVGLLYDASPPPSSWTAAGAAGLVWAILTVPAYHRRYQGEHTLWDTLTRRIHTTDEPVEPSAPPDPAELLAAVFELSLRRREARGLHNPITSPVAWTVVDGYGHRFRAVTVDDRAPVKEVIGYAYNSEMLEDHLSDTAHPPAMTRLRWERDELRPSLGDDASDKGHSMPAPSTDMPTFIDSSTAQLERLVAHFVDFRAEYRSDYSPDFPISAYLENQARYLNENRPLMDSHLTIRPRSPRLVGEHHSRIDIEGWAEFYDWIDVRAVVKTQDLRWNDFGSHRPEMVTMIAESLHDAEDLRTTVRAVSATTDMSLSATMMARPGPSMRSPATGYTAPTPSRSGTHRSWPSK